MDKDMIDQVYMLIRIIKETLDVPKAKVLHDWAMAKLEEIAKEIEEEAKEKDYAA